MPEEARLETVLARAVKEAGGLCIKLPAQWYRGIPDRLILLPKGRVRFVELKAQKGRVSVHQNKFRQTLFKLGFRVDIVRGNEQLIKWIEENLHA